MPYKDPVKQKEYYAEYDLTRRNRNERNAKRREHYQKNSEEISKRRKANYNFTYHQNYRLIKKYGLSLEQFNEILEAQKGVCAICGGNRREGKMLCVDHCHKTGEVRGLLCDVCNLGLGKFDDNIEWLRGAIKYLER